ncbi:hypothetical protein [Lewinella sp. 4G2]|uniref:hypothetical protein n=1 Tax=Lewinella sp. 4G2 TaxID=1803372 RepID=UPI0007B4620F|nr:hypothetical protein [Lewinella sp. 4G2]OAV46177.1 hypothetical protein A3850_018125 [Lewinella sp. 4G2]
MKEQDYVDIERWLDGDLAADELANFKRRQATDPTFAQAVAEREELYAHLRATVGEADFRRTIVEAMQQSPREAKVIALEPRKRKRTWMVALSAAATILLLILAFQFFNDGAGFDDSLYGDHPPIALVERGTGTSIAQEAEAKFNAGEYAAAIAPLRELLTQAPNGQAQLALGISLMETNKNEEAKEVFQQLASANSEMAGYANWYLALLALKKGEAAAVEKYLDAIPKSDAALQEKARKLREAL